MVRTPNKSQFGLVLAYTVGCLTTKMYLTNKEACVSRVLHCDKTRRAFENLREM